MQNKYDANEHIKVLAEVNTLLDIANETQVKINVLKKQLVKIDEAEIIRCNSSGLMIYNPKNAAEMLKSMKNKNQTREEKILARVKYEQQQAQK